MKTPGRSGRPRAFHTADVLDAALEEFWSKGVRSTTTRDLETAVGLSQSSLYNAFGSKQGLLLAALDLYEDRVNKAVVVPLEEALDGLGSIARFFDNLAAWVTSDGKRGCLIVNLMAEDGGEDEGITQRTTAYRKRCRGALRTALGRAARRGEIAPASVESRADLLMGMVLGLNIAARGGAEGSELSGLLAAVRTQLEAWRAAPCPSDRAEPADR